MLCYLENLTVDDVLAVQVRSWYSRDEELAACSQPVVSIAELDK